MMRCGGGVSQGFELYLEIPEPAGIIGDMGDIALTLQAGASTFAGQEPVDSIFSVGARGTHLC